MDTTIEAILFRMGRGLDCMENGDMPEAYTQLWSATYMLLLSKMKEEKDAKG